MVISDRLEPCCHGGSRSPLGRVVRAAVPLALVIASGAGCQGLDATEGPVETGDVAAAVAVAPASAAHQGAQSRRCDWEQWGGDAGHTGAACEEVHDLDRISSQMTFDPFLGQELADAEIQAGFGALFTHFQSPLLVGDDVYMEFKAGTYTSCASVPAGQPCGRDAWNTQVWTERAFHWSHGRLIADWTFESDWKPEPAQLVRWEPVFHAVVVGKFVYVPGASGTLHKLDRHTGRKLATIRLPGVGQDPNTYVAGGVAADAHGNLYYNALALEAGAPFLRGAWLVKVRPDDTVQTAAYATLVAGAPAATDLCVTQFSRDQLPWPPAPDAVPPSLACGGQRPPVNLTPAIGEDGTVVTVSTAHQNPRYTYLVAVHADLTPKWTASLRGILHDGCGVTTPSDATADTTDPRVLQTHCRVGANTGVDPATNQPPAGLAIDQSSSSPVILPDGGVLYGAFTAYNQQRGHLFRFDAQGRPAGTFDFGWDVTPAVYRHDGTYSIITKDNQYFDQKYYISQIDRHLRREWTFQSSNPQSCHRDASGNVVCVDDGQHPTGFEWCVNAPAVDPEGNVYANSEDGWVYKIAQGGRLVHRTFLLQSLGAAYTPVSIDRKGRLFSINGGDLFVIGGGHEPGHGDDR